MSSDKDMKPSYKDTNYYGLNWDQFKLLLISLGSFAVSAGFLFYFGSKDGTIKSNWIFTLYVITAIASYYLYYSMVI